MFWNPLDSDFKTVIGFQIESRFDIEQAYIAYKLRLNMKLKFID